MARAGDNTPMAHQHRLSIVLGWLGISLVACQQLESNANDGDPRPLPAASLRTSDAPTSDAPKSDAPTSELPAPPAVEAVAADPLEPVGPPTSGAVVLGRSNGKLLAFVADADERAIVVIDVDAAQEVLRHPLDGEPSQLLVTDGRLIVSVASTARVEALVLSGPRLVERAAVEVAAEPTGLAATAAGKLLVASRWGAALSVLDGATLALEKQVPLGRDPHAVVPLADGKRALVTHVVGGRISVVDIDEGGVVALDAGRVDQKGFRAKDPTHVTTHRRAVQAFAAARADDGTILVAATLADGSRAPSGTGYGGGMSDIRTQAGVEMVVDADGSTVSIPRGTARDLNNDCFLPRAAAWDETVGLLLLACVGTDRVVAVEAREKPAGMVRYAVRVPTGPTGVAIDPATRRWVAWSQFAGVLSVGALRERHGASRSKPQLIAIDRRAPLPEAVARGRALFHQAGPKRRVAGDGRACASCHPSGRDDAMTWATLDGPRNTPVLMGRITNTAPFGWNGRMADLDQHLQRTVDRLLGIGITQAQRADLVAYITHMQPPAHHPSDARVARGKEIYTANNRCSSCHPLGTQTTDGQAHDLGNLDAFDVVRTFDTPTLRFVAHSAPYFHDGRYASLDELLRDPATGMGSHADLDTPDREALIAFLETL